MDRQIKIKSYLGPVAIQISPADYRFILKCLNYNILYDDGLEDMIRK